MKRLTALAAALLLSACALQLPKPPAERLADLSTRAVLDPAPLTEVDTDVVAMISQQQMPGAEVWIEHAGASYHRAYGQRAVQPVAEPATEDTLYDAASLTKPIVTATLVQIMRQRHKLDLDSTVARYLPECATGDLAPITLRQLLTHTSGLPEGLPHDGDWSGIDGALRAACALHLQSAPGTRFVYSDVNYILLGIIVARVGGQPLDVLAQQLVFAPLGMADSGFTPLHRFSDERIAPTAVVDGQFLRGVVHDPTARRMGGVAGNAGLFTTTADLARFARMLLNDGMTDDGVRILSTESVAFLTTSQTPAGIAKRSYGWDIDSPYSRPRGELYPKTSFGHTGFTGCAIWLDPHSHSFFILLSNRVHPGQPTNILPLYSQLGTLAARASGIQAAQSQ